MNHLIRPLSTWLALVPLLLSTAAQAAAPQWQATWMASAQPAWDEHFVLPLGMPRSFRDATLRQTLRTTLGGERLRLVVSNEHGNAPLRIGRLTLRPAGREVGHWRHARGST